MNITPLSAHFVFYVRSAVMIAVAVVLYVYAELNVSTYSYLTWAFTAAAFIQNTEQIKAPLLMQRLDLLKLPWEHR